MGGRSRPLACCDRDCAEANGCRTGGYRCESCGLWYCADEIDSEGLCCNCGAEREEHTCSECGEYDPDTELEDGLCPECAEETRRERIEEKRLALIVKEVQGDRKEKENDQSRDASV